MRLPRPALGIREDSSWSPDTVSEGSLKTNFWGNKTKTWASWAHNHFVAPPRQTLRAKTGSWDTLCYQLWGPNKSCPPPPRPKVEASGTYTRGLKRPTPETSQVSSKFCSYPLPMSVNLYLRALCAPNSFSAQMSSVYPESCSPPTIFRCIRMLAKYSVCARYIKGVPPPLIIFVLNICLGCDA